MTATYNKHHINALAKHLLTQAVSVAVGLSKVEHFRCSMADIERNSNRHQSIYNALLADGYVVDGRDDMLICDKAFDEVEPLPWIGPARCGDPTDPLAFWLSNGILKSIYEKLADGTAYITKRPGGVVMVVARESGSVGFSEFLLGRLGELAQKHTDLCKASAECLHVAYTSVMDLSPDELCDVVTGSLVSRRLDLARSKREVDALVSFEAAVDSAGGWTVFLQRARRDYGGG